jgi:hypothetical protein
MIVRALEELGYGKCKWRVRNEEIYENLFWLDDETEKPTEAEIQEKIAELQAAEPLRLLRIQRNQLIKETDWRATVDYPNSDKQAWLDYRQALRDLPATADPQLDENGQLINIVWPEEPQ